MTVRFEEPPLPGIRIYFCQHLTPEYVWREDLQRHANQMAKLAYITGYAADPVAVATCISAVADIAVSLDGAAAEISMPNLRLRIDQDCSAHIARLCAATLLAKDGTSLTLDLGKATLFRS